MKEEFSAHSSQGKLLYDYGVEFNENDDFKYNLLSYEIKIF